MTATLADTQPVVLVVEDDERALDLGMSAFADAGCVAVGAPSREEAVRELEENFVDLVLADIHLASTPHDKSGVDLARFVKATYPDLPVAGYSAVFMDQDLSGDKDVFDAIWPKGALDYRAFGEMIELCRALAVKHHRPRDTAGSDAQRRSGSDDRPTRYPTGERRATDHAEEPNMSTERTGWSSILAALEHAAPAFLTSRDIARATELDQEMVERLLDERMARTRQWPAPVRGQRAFIAASQPVSLREWLARAQAFLRLLYGPWRSGLRF